MAISKQEPSKRKQKSLTSGQGKEKARTTRVLRKKIVVPMTATERVIAKRAIDILGKSTVAAVEGQGRTTRKTVRLASLQIDMFYQRTLKPALVCDIMEAFTWEGFGMPTVGVRKDGTSWIIDGQQRITAAKALNITSAEVKIIASKGSVHEAEIFHRLNAESAALTKVQEFKAGLHAGIPTPTNIVKSVKAAGMEVSTEDYGRSVTWPKIRAIGQLEKIYKYGGSQVMEAVLSLVVELWPEEDDAVREEVIGGVYLLVTRSKDKRDATTRGLEWLAAPMHGKTETTNRERIVEMVHNKKLSSWKLHERASKESHNVTGYNRIRAAKDVLEKICGFRAKQIAR